MGYQTEQHDAFTNICEGLSSKVLGGPFACVRTVDMRIDYEVRGADEAIIRIRTIPQDVERQVREITREAADLAYAAMVVDVPQSAKTGSEEREPHRSIKDSLAVEEATYEPGGLGGGGTYEVRTGPIDQPPSHLESVVGGSNRFPLVGNFMGVLGYPGNFFRHRQGQLPQREWIDDAIENAERHVATRIRTIHIG